MTPVEKHIACLRSNWHSVLTEQALPLVDTIALPQADVEVMRAHRTALPVLAHIRPGMITQDGIFLKLGGFSFKDVDAWHILGNGRIRDEADVRFLISGGLPRRAVWALAEMAAVKAEVPLDVLLWQPIKPQSEFRVFVVQGQIKGMTPYHTQASIDADPARLEQRLTEYVIGLLPHLPKCDVALDLAVFRDGPRVIELNPIGPGLHLGQFTQAQLRDAAGELRLVNQSQPH